MRLVCISDTHGDHELVTLPEGDVLIHAGDISAHGTADDTRKFIEWFSRQAFKHHIFIAGNHDAYCESDPQQTQQWSKDAGVTWLNDSGCVIEDTSFWGSPITPRFLHWSFMRDPGEDIEKHWKMIPEDTKVLITHGPPKGILDEVNRSTSEVESTGSRSLLAHIRQHPPQLHIFGHIHECYGLHREHGVDFHNVSTMNQGYKIQNAPVVIDI